MLTGLPINYSVKLHTTHWIYLVDLLEDQSNQDAGQNHWPRV